MAALKSATPPDVRDVDDIEDLIPWRRELTAGAEAEIRNDFSLSYPKGQRARGER